MPNKHHYTVVARELKHRLDGKAFETVPRAEITSILRRVSGEDTTRIKTNIADELERAMLEQGVRVYPSLVTTTTVDYVRIFRTGTLLGELVDLMAHPTVETDKRLGDFLKKIKGQWLARTGSSVISAAA